jgi:hypothetical protein
MTPAQKRAREARAHENRVQAGRADPKQDSSAPTQARSSSRGKNPLKSRIWSERIIPAVIRDDAGICHACYAMGCLATGADSADHHPVPLVACEARGIDPLARSNLRAIHHKPCPWCNVRCNVVKRDQDMDVFRLKWEKLTGRTAVAPGSSTPSEEGREW